MATGVAPRGRGDFEIALICALSLEAECVQAVFDRFWEDEGKTYGKALGDSNSYTAGVIGKHNVILAYMPGIGTNSAAAVAGRMRMSFPNIKLALVVGICGGMPYGTDQEEILLGDIIISQALIQYDFGSQYPNAFKKKDTILDSLGRPSQEILGIQARLRTHRYKQKMHEDIAKFLREIQLKLPCTKTPAREKDILYQSSYVHQHHAPAACGCGEGGQICEAALRMGCEELGCGVDMRVSRNRPDISRTHPTEPLVHFGIMGSGNTVMKSGQHRDEAAETHGIIAFDMEGAGVWDCFPSIVIKGVCDYADSHKKKGWQHYAAATAACCMKAFLKEWDSGDRAPVPAPDHELVPRDRRVKTFFGREAELTEISAIFNCEAEEPRFLILHAMGGQGKSQIALEYCRRWCPMYRGIFWINSTSTSTIVQSVVGIGQEIDSSAVGALESDDAKVGFVLRTLKKWDARWLMVFDNHDDPKILSNVVRYTPKGGKGDILITSRHRGLEELGTVIDIPPMPDEAGVLLLLHRYPQVNVHDHISEASKIVSRLGGLPLAIAQASAYMAYKHLPVDQLGGFLTLFEAEREIVLQHVTDQFWKYSRIDDESGQQTAINAFTTWEMSFRQLSNNWDRPHLVARFLTLAAFLGPVHVNEFLFEFHTEGSKPPPDWSGIFTVPGHSDHERSSNSSNEAQYHKSQKHRTHDRSRRVHNSSMTRSQESWDAERYWRLIEQAYQMSLIQDISPQTSPGGATFLLHPLIRDWLQLRVSSEERQTYPREVVDVLRWASTREDITTCANAEHFALFYAQHGQLCVSHDLLRTIIATRIRMQGVEHPDTLASMARLAWWLECERKYPQAETLYWTVMKAKAKVLGMEHLDTIDIMDGLAVVLCRQEKYVEAERMHRKVVEVRKTRLGEEHPDTLASMINLAATLKDQDKFTEAQKISQEVMESMESLTKGKSNESLVPLRIMTHLFEVLKSQEMYIEAEHICREVMRVGGSLVEKEQSETLSNMDNLADTLRGQGRYIEAENIYREVLEVREASLGKEHSHTMEAMTNLAGVLYGQKRYFEAEQIWREVFESRERLLGKDHFVSLSSMSSLSRALRAQEKYVEAEQMCREVLERRESLLGRDHLLTRLSMDNLTEVLLDQRKYEEGAEICARLVTANLKIFGLEHPDSPIWLNRVISMWEMQGIQRRARQEALFELINRSGRRLTQRVVEH